MTPPASTISPGRVSSQLPPVSAARSTITEPGRIALDRRGGDQPRCGPARNRRGRDHEVEVGDPLLERLLLALPAPRASARARSRPRSPRRRRRGRGTSHRASAPARATAGRTSKPETTAPSRRAVAIACRPATPAPSTSARAGAIVPAAVVSIGRNRGRCSAASSTALYPATVACDESASIDWARVVRGIDSIANPSTPFAASCSIPARSVNGCRNAIRSWPRASFSTSAALGLRTLTTASTSRQASSTSSAPASAYAASVNPAAVAGAALDRRRRSPRAARPRRGPAQRGARRPRSPSGRPPSCCARRYRKGGVGTSRHGRRAAPRGAGSDP